MERIIPRCHDAGARVVLDGVSYAPHAAIDVKALDVDFYLYSLYKTYGPHLGLLYARREHLDGIQNQGHFFNAEHLDKRLTPAGPDHGEIACASGIVDYYDALYAHAFETDASVRDRVQQVFESIARHEQVLMEPLFDCLDAKPGVRIIGYSEADRSRRVPTVSFTSVNRSNRELVEAMAAEHIGCGFGHFYAYRLMEHLGIDPGTGVARISMVHYNTLEEVYRVTAVLDRLL